MNMNQKGIAPILIIILIALGIGGYLLYQKQIKPTSPLQNPQASQSTPDETANWEIYTNKTYKYNLKYPRQLAYSGKDSTVYFSENTTPMNILKYRIEVNKIKRNFEKIYNAPDDFFIQDEIDTLGHKFIKQKNLLIDNVKAVSYKYELSNDQIKKGETGGLTQGIIINKDGLMIEVIIQSTTIPPATPWFDLQEFDQILSTFKFIDQEQNQKISISSTTNNLVTISYIGGLCPDGVCSSVQAILKDGSFFIDGKLKSQIQKSEISQLENLINTTNFEAIKAVKFTGTCPTAYDGQEATYTFNTSHGQETLSSCRVKIDYQSALFSKINDVLSL